jgi:trimeric autotransporter adhesin
MKTKSNILAQALPAFIILTSAFCLQVEGQGTAFTYQGRLNDGGNPANGRYDFRFRIASDPLGNNYVGNAFLTNGIPVSNGLFTATMDFGPGVFTGSNDWLEVDVRTNGIGGYTALNPLQALTPTPYAIFASTASNLSGTLPAGQLTGTYGNAVTFNNTGNSFSGNGSGLTGVNAATLNGLGAGNFWQTTGNAGTTPGANFLGTSDNQPLELRVNGQRALQLLPDLTTNDAPDIVGGSSSNGLSGSLVGTTISGGAWNTIGPVSPFSTNNPYGDFSVYPTLSASYSTIAGGFLNQVQADATFSTIAGGAINTIQNGNVESTIGGGFGNLILTNASWSIIAGGTHHRISSVNGFIGGGWMNTIQTNSGYSVVVGGSFNGVLGNASSAFIGGGYGNAIGPDGFGGGGSSSVIGGGLNNTNNEYYSFIGGGQQNTIQGLADDSVIAGGGFNVIAGSYAQLVYSVIGGGYGNSMKTNTSYAVIGGGFGNSLGTAYYQTIGGGYVNSIGTNASGSTIAGGYNNGIQPAAVYSTIGGGSGNAIQTIAFNANIGGYNATIAGGLGNIDGSPYTSMGGGVDNIIGTNSNSGTIAGGYENFVNNNTFDSVIGGGSFHSIGTNSADSTIGGGSENSIGNNSSGGTVGGGVGNKIQTSAFYSTIGGGYVNAIQTNASFSAISGGLENVIANGAYYSTIPGGYMNTVADPFGFAAGDQAQALHSGAFVWADSRGYAFPSTAVNQFSARATGGVRFVTGLDGSGNPDAGVSLAAGSGSWTSLSDRNAKENFAPVNAQAVLAKVAALPLSTWNYKAQPAAIRHIGPMAQDFKAAFHVGESDRGITTVDAEGVALAAIQGLNQKLNEKDAEIKDLKARLDKVQQQLQRLEETK